MHRDAQRESSDLNINTPDPHAGEPVVHLITPGHTDVGFLLTFEAKTLVMNSFNLILVRWDLVFSEANSYLVGS